MPLAAAAGIAFGAGGMFLWSAYGQGATAIERGRTERIVHDYLLNHPEIVPEALEVLRDRQTGQIIAAEGAAFLKPYAGAWGGNPRGDVTIVEYFDYNCGFCRAMLPEIDRLVAADPGIKIVYREWPVLSEESRLAARYSLVAAEQGKFGAFHHALYKAGPVSEASIRQTLISVGINPDAARAAAESPRIAQALDDNLATARRLGLSGTPSWVIGDHAVSSVLPLEEMQRLVARARARG